MKIFGFVGNSDSGKTKLLQKLVGELKNRGHKVSVIKHCAHGFDLLLRLCQGVEEGYII